MVLDNQKLCIQAAIMTAAGADRNAVKLIRIRDTLHITEIEISEALLEEARSNPQIEIVEGPYALPFDEEGNLF